MGASPFPLGSEQSTALGGPHSDRQGSERPRYELYIKWKLHTWQDGTKNACWAIESAVGK